MVLKEIGIANNVLNIVCYKVRTAMEMPPPSYYCHWMFLRDSRNSPAPIFDFLEGYEYLKLLNIEANNTFDWNLNRMALFDANISGKANRLSYQ